MQPGAALGKLLQVQTFELKRIVALSGQILLSQPD